MKQRYLLFLLLIMSSLFSGCSSTCPVCRGASSPGSSIQCDRCNGTGEVVK